MKMNNYVVHSRESLIFRDGRPFGDAGHVFGGTLLWPMPSTILGMLRNRTGCSRAGDYFSGPDRQANIECIKKITATCLLPQWLAHDSQTWEPLFPVPADALVMDDPAEGAYTIHRFDLSETDSGEGIDLPWSNWRVPVSHLRDKPARESPALWFKDRFFSWLENNHINGPIKARELGLPWPLQDIRMHTAVDNAGTAKEHQLFSTRGIRLESPSRPEQKPGRYGIGIRLDGLKSSDNPAGICRLGGERRIAMVDVLNDAGVLPPCPDWFGDDRFLRLILIAPGSFGGWAPGWLRPDENDGEKTPWTTVPGTDIKVRLVSAFMPRWRPVSGWDLENRKPKATRKLVPAGSVYVVELRDPSCSAALAAHVWGKTIADNQQDPDGYGCVCVGKLDI